MTVTLRRAAATGMGALLLLVAVVSAGVGCGDDPAPVAPEVLIGVTETTDPAAGDSALPWPADLPLTTLRTVGDLPTEAGLDVVVIGANGSFSMSGREIGCFDVASRLDGSPGAPVLIAADRDAPWGAAGWVLTCCAASLRPRVFHAAVPADGGSPGAIATILPTEGFNDLRDDDRAPPVIRVAVTTGWPPSDVLGLHDPLRAQSGAIVEVDAAPQTTVGRVLRIVDVAALEGAATVTFVARVPFAQAALDTELAGWLDADPARRITLDGQEIRGPAVLLPAGGRVVGGYAGFPEPYEGPWPAAEEIEPVDDR